MPNIEKYENLVLGSGGAGKFIAWTMAGAGRRTALVERKALGGACPNVACLPSKNIIYSAKVAALARRGAEFGLKTEALSVDMKTVQRRKQLMVEGLHQMHVDRTKASGAELIMGNARFVAPRTVEIDLNSGGKRTIYGDRVFLDLGTRAAMPAVRQFVRDCCSRARPVGGRADTAGTPAPASHYSEAFENPRA